MWRINKWSGYDEKREVTKWEYLLSQQIINRVVLKFIFERQNIFGLFLFCFKSNEHLIEDVFVRIIKENILPNVQSLYTYCRKMALVFMLLQEISRTIPIPDQNALNPLKSLLQTYHRSQSERKKNSKSYDNDKIIFPFRFAFECESNICNSYIPFHLKLDCNRSGVERKRENEREI